VAEQTVETILEAATALFAKRGAEGITVLEIAKRASVSAGTVIYHFKSKDNLLFIISREIFSRLHRQSQQAMLLAGSPLAALHAFIDTFFAQAEASPDSIAFLARFDPFTRLDLDSFPNADLMVLKDRYVGLVAEYVSCGIAGERFNPVDPAAFAILTWAALQGFCRVASQMPSFGELALEFKRMLTFRLTGTLPEETAQGLASTGTL
jgi:TetR/AcrR family fatty acid metabolism transcriptional regulator